MLKLPKVPEMMPARPLAVFRIAVGLVVFVKGLELIGKTMFFAAPKPAFPIIPLLPTPVFTILAVPMVATGIMIVLGYRTRLAALVTGLITLVVVHGAYYYEHIYMIATIALMLALTDSDAALSVRSRRGLGSDTVWAPPVYLIRAQISIVYVYAALAKINFDFLSGNGLALLQFKSAVVPEAVKFMPLLVPMAISAIAAELFIGIGLWIPKIRKFSVAVGFLLHVNMIVYISPNIVAVVDLVLFAAIMFAGYGLFLHALPDFVVRKATAAWDRVAGTGHAVSARPKARAESPAGGRQ